MKKWLYYLCIMVIVAIVSCSFRPIYYEKPNKLFINDKQESHNSYSSLEVVHCGNFKIPFTGKSFTGFKEAIAFKESQGQYKLVNSFGYIGKYQFGNDALKAIGVNNKVAFLNNPKLQEIAFRVLLSKNKSILQKEIKKYNGKVINGIKITESGILAAAHLGGAGSVKKYLKSRGKRAIKDDFGTSVPNYIKAFGGYDTSSIEINANANVCMK